VVRWRSLRSPPPVKIYLDLVCNRGVIDPRPRRRAVSDMTPEQMDMQESKEINWPSDYNAETQEDSRCGADLHPNGLSAVYGWQKHRRRISKAPLPRERLGGSAPSLYTLNVYTSWAEQVRRNWPEE